MIIYTKQRELFMPTMQVADVIECISAEGATDAAGKIRGLTQAVNLLIKSEQADSLGDQLTPAIFVNLLRPEQPAEVINAALFILEALAKQDNAGTYKFWQKTLIATLINLYSNQTDQYNKLILQIFQAMSGISYQDTPDMFDADLMTFFEAQLEQSLADEYIAPILRAIYNIFVREIYIGDLPEQFKLDCILPHLSGEHESIQEDAAGIVAQVAIARPHLGRQPSFIQIFPGKLCALLSHAETDTIYYALEALDNLMTEDTHSLYSVIIDDRSCVIRIIDLLSHEDERIQKITAKIYKRLWREIHCRDEKLYHQEIFDKLHGLIKVEAIFEETLILIEDMATSGILPLDQRTPEAVDFFEKLFSLVADKDSLKSYYAVSILVSLSRLSDLDNITKGKQKVNVIFTRALIRKILFATESTLLYVQAFFIYVANDIKNIPHIIKSGVIGTLIDIFEVSSKTMIEMLGIVPLLSLSIGSGNVDYQARISTAISNIDDSFDVSTGGFSNHIKDILDNFPFYDVIVQLGLAKLLRSMSKQYKRFSELRLIKEIMQQLLDLYKQVDDDIKYIFSDILVNLSRHDANHALMMPNELSVVVVGALNTFAESQQTALVIQTQVATYCVNLITICKQICKDLSIHIVDFIKQGIYAALIKLIIIPQEIIVNSALEALRDLCFRESIEGEPEIESAPNQRHLSFLLADMVVNVGKSSLTEEAQSFAMEMLSVFSVEADQYIFSYYRYKLLISKIAELLLHEDIAIKSYSYRIIYHVSRYPKGLHILQEIDSQTDSLFKLCVEGLSDDDNDVSEDAAGIIGNLCKKNRVATAKFCKLQAVTKLLVLIKHPLAANIQYALLALKQISKQQPIPYELVSAEKNLIRLFDLLNHSEEVIQAASFELIRSIINDQSHSYSDEDFNLLPGIESMLTAEDPNLTSVRYAINVLVEILTKSPLDEAATEPTEILKNLISLFNPALDIGIHSYLGDIIYKYLQKFYHSDRARIFALQVALNATDDFILTHFMLLLTESDVSPSLMTLLPFAAKAAYDSNDNVLDNSKFLNLLVQSNFIEAQFKSLQVATSLSTYENRLEVLEVLDLIALNTDARAKMAIAPHIQQLIQMFDDQERAIQTNCFRLVFYISQSHGHDALAPVPVLTKIANALKHEESGIREDAAGILWNLANKRILRAKIGTTQALKHLVALLKDPSIEVIRYALKALTRLSTDHRDNAQAILQAIKAQSVELIDGKPSLIHHILGIEDDEAEINEHAQRLLENIANCDEIGYASRAATPTGEELLAITSVGYAQQLETGGAAAEAVAASAAVPAASIVSPGAQQSTPVSASAVTLQFREAVALENGEEEVCAASLC